MADLHARTDGWAAGLRLAALALRRTDDPAGFLTAFSGDERSVADYLTGEILAGLAPDTRDFLRAVSVCSPLPGALAAQLSGRPDAEALLDELGKQTALVESHHPAAPTASTRCCAPTSSPTSRRHRPEAYRDLQARRPLVVGAERAGARPAPRRAGGDPTCHARCCAGPAWPCCSPGSWARCAAP